MTNDLREIIEKEESQSILNALETYTYAIVFNESGENFEESTLKYVNAKKIEDVENLILDVIGIEGIIAYQKTENNQALGLIVADGYKEVKFIVSKVEINTI